MGNYFEAPVNCPASSVIKRFALVTGAPGPEPTPRNVYGDLVFWIGSRKYYYDMMNSTEVIVLYGKIKNAPSKGRAYNQFVKAVSDYYLRSAGV